MSGQLYAVAGSKLYIGEAVNAKGQVSVIDFAGQDWVKIGGWASAGSIGDTQAVGEQSLIDENRTRKFKGLQNGGSMENTFVPMALDAGQKRFKEAIASCKPYAFKIEWGSGCAPESEVTIAIGDPGVVTWTDHGLLADQPVIFAVSDGVMPGGLAAGTAYYVLAAGLTASTFQVAATIGGEAIEVTAPVSGTVGDITGQAPPVGMTEMFYGLATPGARSGGAADAVHLRTWTIAIDTNIVEV